jgi:hypothetical protein
MKNKNKALVSCEVIFTPHTDTAFGSDGAVERAHHGQDEVEHQQRRRQAPSDRRHRDKCKAATPAEKNMIRRASVVAN